MTNRDRADRLIAEAAEILQDLSGLLHRRAWNLAIRRAQEVVELTLKGLLAEMGSDYPKVHDVAPQFAALVRARNLNVADEDLTWLEQVSARLAVTRAPAFYFEAEFGEGEARRAVTDAGRVMELGKALLQQLRG